MTKSRSDLLIAQWNAQGMTAHGADFLNSVFENKLLGFHPDIICIQETWFNDYNVSSIPNYICVCKNRPDGRRGGLVMYLKNDITFQVMNTNGDAEYQRVDVFSKKGIISIFNYYNPCKRIESVELNDMIRSVPGKIMILGDFNSHNPLWGSSKLDTNGRTVESFMENNDLALLNDKSPTRLDPHFGTYSNLDLSIVSKELACSIEWNVLSNNFGSDHNLVCINFRQAHNTTKHMKNANMGYRWSFRKVNWEEYRREIKEEMRKEGYESISSDLDIQGQYNLIVKVIKNASNRCIRRVQIGGEKRSKITPWWNNACQKAVQERNRIKNRLRRYYDLKDVKQYLQKKAFAQKVQRRAQYDYWSQYCGRMNRFTDIGKVWKQVKGMRDSTMNKHMFHDLIVDGSIVHESQEKANAVATFFKSIDESFSVNKNENEDIPYDSSINNDDCINDDFNMSEMRNVLKEMKNSSPGKDDIYLIMIKNMPNKALVYLLNLYNDIWKTSSFPHQWYEVIQIPILKPGKDPTQVTSYRPISLLSTLFKVMEKMIKNRLTWYLDKYGLLNPLQSGFRKYRSVKDHLVRLETDVHLSLKEKKYTVAVFLDLEKAYDSLWKSGLLRKMSVLGIRGKFWLFIKAFLQRRISNVKVNNCMSHHYVLENGIPQGSSLSPLLFSLMLNDLKIKESEVKLSCYADDIAIWYSNTDLELVRKKLQDALHEIEIWCWMWKLNISHTKSAVLVFTNKLKKDIVLKMKGHILPLCEQYKFLGVWLDSKLTWSVHINAIIDKCKKRLNLLRCVSGTLWGNKYEILMMMYKGLILSILDYGSEMYDSACLSLKNKLDSIQYRALKIITGTIYNVSLEALQVLTGELPLKHRRKMFNDKFRFYLLFSTLNHPTKEILGDYNALNTLEWKAGEGPFTLRACRDEVEVERQDDLVPKIPEWRLTRPQVSLENQRKIHKKEMLEVEMKSIALDSIGIVWNGYLHVYTDGSKLEDGRTGAAFYVSQYHVVQNFRISQVCIMRAELIAILMALEWIDTFVKSSSVVIFSDSLSALQMIDSYFIRCAIVNEILFKIHMLKMKDICVAFEWIPSHCDINGNEIVDRAAKKGAMKDYIDINLPNTTSELTCSRLIHYKKIWQTEWNSSENGRFLYSLHNNVTKPIHRQGLSRREECLIQQLRVGKCRLNYYLFQINQHVSGLCEVCQEVETIEHFILHCSKYDRERRILVEKSKLKNPNLKQLLISDPSHTRELLCYIYATNRFG